MSTDLTLERIFYCVTAELEGARRKFPSNKHMLAALQEEAGEITREVLQLQYGKGSNAKIFKECVQTMAMCIRLIQEGDPEFKYTPEYDSYRNFQATGSKKFPDDVAPPGTQWVDTHV